MFFLLYSDIFLLCDGVKKKNVDFLTKLSMAVKQTRKNFELRSKKNKKAPINKKNVIGLGRLRSLVDVDKRAAAAIVPPEDN